jgi:hypothetical protein
MFNETTKRALLKRQTTNTHHTFPKDRKESKGKHDIKNFQFSIYSFFPSFSHRLQRDQTENLSILQRQDRTRHKNSTSLHRLEQEKQKKDRRSETRHVDHIQKKRSRRSIRNPDLRDREQESRKSVYVNRDEDAVKDKKPGWGYSTASQGV